LALAVPLSRFTPQVGGGSAFFVRPHYIAMPDPITIITTLHGLAEKLVNSIKGGQDAAKAQEILRLVGELQTEYFALQQHILKIETENANLVRQVASPKPPNPKQKDDDIGVVPDLDDVSVKILQMFVESPRGIPKAMIFAHFGLSIGKGNFIFDQLTKHDFIEVTSFVMGRGGDLKYHATQKCREYLNKKGLL
jgi:hypothetical protein